MNVDLIVQGIFLTGMALAFAAALRCRVRALWAMVRGEDCAGMCRGAQVKAASGKAGATPAQTYSEAS